MSLTDKPGVPGAGRGPKPSDASQRRPPQGAAGGVQYEDRMRIQMEHDLRMNRDRNRRAALQMAVDSTPVNEDDRYLDPAWPAGYRLGQVPRMVPREAALRGAAERWEQWLTREDED